MEFINTIRLDVLSCFLLVFILILSGLRNQKKVWRNLLCLIFAIAIVGVPLYFDLGGIFTKCFTFLNARVFPIVGNLFKTVDTTLLFPFLGSLVLMLAIFLVEMILVGICKLIGGSDRRRYKKYPAYATVHHPVAGIIG